jgi:catechol 2,3-dioxygenase-like lactoylglutathione lyase family enzyme
MKFYTILTLFFIVQSTQAQTDNYSARYFSAIIVSDMDTSIQWYSEVLEFEIENQVTNEIRGFRQANLKRGNVFLELIELNRSLSTKEIGDSKTRIQGFFKFGFSVRQFDQLVGFLEQSQVQFNGSVVGDPVTKKQMLIILDPDGNRVQLFEE